MQEKKDMSSFW